MVDFPMLAERLLALISLVYTLISIDIPSFSVSFFFVAACAFSIASFTVFLDTWTFTVSFVTVELVDAITFVGPPGFLVLSTFVVSLSFGLSLLDPPEDELPPDDPPLPSLL